jgi:hypothetical protein
MDERITVRRLEGVVTSVELTGGSPIKSRDSSIETDILDGKRRKLFERYIKFCIKDSSGKEEFNKMPLDIGDGQLISGAMTGQRVVYDRNVQLDGSSWHISERLYILSGQCAGVQYEYNSTVTH